MSLPTGKNCGADQQRRSETSYALTVQAYFTIQSPKKAGRRYTRSGSTPDLCLPLQLLLFNNINMSTEQHTNHYDTPYPCRTSSIINDVATFRGRY